MFFKSSVEARMVYRLHREIVLMNANKKAGEDSPQLSRLSKLVWGQNILGSHFRVLK